MNWTQRRNQIILLKFPDYEKHDGDTSQRSLSSVKIISIDKAFCLSIYLLMFNFHIEEIVQKQPSSTSIEESIPLVQEVAVQKEPRSASIQELVLVVQEEVVKKVAPSTSIPQIPVHPHRQEANAELVPSLSVQAKEQQGNAASVSQQPVHPEESAIKTRKQRTFYEWLLAPLTGEENWECENLEKELIQKKLSQSQNNPAKYWKMRVKLRF